MIRIAVVYATLGRPDLIQRSVARLERQTRPADRVVISAVNPTDVGEVATVHPDVDLLFGDKGLCAQRNRALLHLAGAADVTVFFDDDFVPADDYLAEIERIFLDHPGAAGVTGRVIADGIKTPGYSFDDGLALIARDGGWQDQPTTPGTGLYGCNMAIRMVRAEGLWFDEAMPLYGWLEDVDFGVRLSRCGDILVAHRAAGVHLGTKGGRNSGLKFGYSQIANPIHILRKGTAPRFFIWRLMAGNVLSNLLLSLRPEPYVDRFGRLRGNMLAIVDLLAARIDPRRMLQLD
jgi:GT2 family glycosyltransferase